MAGDRAHQRIDPARRTLEAVLGRYQVEAWKERDGRRLPRQDPKSAACRDRAMRFGSSADELVEVKERFFREAETAGRLSHPNIVTIYDAGEEHDLCYIAMELLKGGDLVSYSKAGGLLPPSKVISIVARAAEALGYAYKQGVVHRDIKPANLMYHPETDTLKVTDFGIARLTDSSKADRNGARHAFVHIAEQLAGKRIEERSTCFARRELYQLLTGRLPFEASRWRS